MSERLVKVDMVTSEGVLKGSGEMYLSLFFYEDGFRQQIVDRQEFCDDGWQGKLDVRVKELTEENVKKNGLAAVVVPKKLFSGYKKSAALLGESFDEECGDDVCDRAVDCDEITLHVK